MTDAPRKPPSDAAPFWHSSISIALFWRADGFGNPEFALYANNLYLGEIMHVQKRPNYKERPYRAWVMTTDDGEEVGWYPTIQAAKDALVDAALKALLP